MSAREHIPIICQRNVATTQYVGKGYKSRFECPACGRKTWQHLSFLGQRLLICDGVPFTKAVRNNSSDCNSEKGSDNDN